MSRRVTANSETMARVMRGTSGLALADQSSLVGRAGWAMKPLHGWEAALMAGLAPPAWLGGSTYGKGNSRPDGGWHPSRVLHHRRRKAWQAGEPQLLRFDSRAEVPSINPRRAASTVPSIARAGQVWSSGSLRSRCVLLPPPSLLLPELARAPQVRARRRDFPRPHVGP